jgi:hypothetical protein
MHRMKALVSPIQQVQIHLVILHLKLMQKKREPSQSILASVFTASYIEETVKACDSRMESIP